MKKLQCLDLFLLQHQSKSRYQKIESRQKCNFSQEIHPARFPSENTNFHSLCAMNGQQELEFGCRTEFVHTQCSKINFKTV